MIKAMPKPKSPKRITLYSQHRPSFSVNKSMEYGYTKKKKKISQLFDAMETKVMSKLFLADTTCSPFILLFGPQPSTDTSNFIHFFTHRDPIII